MSINDFNGIGKMSIILKLLSNHPLDWWKHEKDQRFQPNKWLTKRMKVES